MNLFSGGVRMAVSAFGVLVLVLVMAAPPVLANGDDTDYLEHKVRDLENQLDAVRGELDRVRYNTEQDDDGRVDQLATRLDDVESVQARKDHKVFFRGGFTHAMQRRNGSSIQSNVTPVAPQDIADRDGWYIGAGLDFGMTNDMWGMLPKTQVAAEVMFEYKEFANNVQGNGALGNIPSVLAGGAPGNPRDVTVSQFTLTASPKIRFLEGSRIRPWIIPAGMALHVISPTSESVTYLIPGVMFGAGIDYNFWKRFYVGIDGRYHLTADKADGVKVDGMTAGGYIGFGF